jgi:hypothetical protein
MKIFVFALFYPEDGVSGFLRSTVIFRTARCDIPDYIDTRTSNLTLQSSVRWLLYPLFYSEDGGSRFHLNICNYHPVRRHIPQDTVVRTWNLAE